MAEDINKNIDPSVAPNDADQTFSGVIDQYDDLSDTAKESARIDLAQQDVGKDGDDMLEGLKNAILAANVPKMVMLTISYALDLGSSDIHIEPLKNRVRVRFRVDGVLRHIVEYPLNLNPAVVSRIKIMSNLKIDEQRIPQDGRADVTTQDGRDMDLRISTLPTVNGEKVVMRLQDKSRKIPDLMDLGFSGISLQNVLTALNSPNGIIINTGPTGSGKTTTLYSCLTRLNKVDVNIMTIEDPVEIQLDGLSQSQVHHDIDYGFAMGMRAALRQDPDIIMVGEIRDKETADTAIEASLTGHLVFSTLHTNSAVESITRLLNMGVPAYLLVSTIEMIVAQRLVRKICDKCKKVSKVSPEMAELIKNVIIELKKHGLESELEGIDLKNLKVYEAPGCPDCNNIGYKGRIGLYEVFKMNNKLRRLISGGATIIDLKEAAQKNGMITLEEAGVIKVLQGKTTLEEVFRVANKDE
ncbi:type II secretion system protein GspE [Candidatus Peregrinibacteria bacterium HGW-Peregrinibacteria-1]|jgi:type IV pilus assembly protein PilB|nr:MAG: type II secretion system protein GspE [Candidatus Peregrinibacteria bacterium HGW-Peregrinibacteria-1]